MVLSLTKRNLIHDRKRILRMRALRYDIGGILLRIERVLEQSFRDPDSQRKREKLGRELIIERKGLKGYIVWDVTTASRLASTWFRESDNYRVGRKASDYL